MSAPAPTVDHGERSLEDVLRAWDGEHAELRHDHASGAWMFVCIHSTRLGPAAGGTRIGVYDSPAEGLADAMGLAAAMTRKLAVADLPFGGGKAVLAVREIPRGEKRRRLLHRYGEILDSLGGRFWTGPDMNTDEHDMDLLPYAMVRSRKGGGSGSSAPATATGVLSGIRASLNHALGSADLQDRLVLVQGMGGVGSHLAELLVEAGARVLINDLDAARVAKVAARMPVEIVASDRVLGTQCNVFAPCAVGGILNERSIPRLRCRIVAGAANNQLATTADGERLRSRGILYAPDYVINAGGSLHGIGLAALSWSGAELDRALNRIGDTLKALYRAADEDGIPTSEAADRLAAARLAQAPGRGPTTKSANLDALAPGNTNRKEQEQ
jgi:leucine dehydrogenase